MPGLVCDHVTSRGVYLAYMRVVAKQIRPLTAQLGALDLLMSAGATASPTRLASAPSLVPADAHAGGQHVDMQTGVRVGDPELGAALRGRSAPHSEAMATRLWASSACWGGGSTRGRRRAGRTRAGRRPRADGRRNARLDCWRRCIGGRAIDAARLG